MEYFTTRLLECKMLDKRGSFAGYGAAYENVDHGDDLIKQGAFSKSIAELTKEGIMPSMFWMHNQNTPVGEWSSVAEDRRGLKVAGGLWVDGGIEDREPTELAKMAYNVVRSKTAAGLSIGYQTVKYSFTEISKRRVRVLEELKLGEISIVSFPMNPKAKITAVKSLLQEGTVADIRVFEEYLRDAGLSRSQAKALLADGYKALNPREADESELQSLIERINHVTQLLK